MGEIKFYYKNCACCSGSGSGSGSGSQNCECQYWANTPCVGESYDACDSIRLRAVITFDYSGCSSFYGGSFWQCTGSVSGLESGVVDGDGSGSGSGSCTQTCPNCCDLLPDRITLDLVCIGDTYVTENLIDANPEDPSWSFDSNCLGTRPDKQTYMIFPSCMFGDSNNCIGLLVIPLDGFYLIFYLYADPFYLNLVSCNPLDIRYSITCGNPSTSAGYDLMPCLSACLGDNICCVRANIVITEAGTGGGGGGPAA
jgi:hypothetical protein